MNNNESGNADIPQNTAQNFIEELLASINSFRSEPLNLTEREKIEESVKYFPQRDAKNRLAYHSLIDEFEFFNAYLHNKLFDSITYLGFCYFAAKHFANHKDSLMVCHFINLAKEYAEKSHALSGKYNRLAIQALNAGHADLAVDLVLKGRISEPDFSDNEKEKLGKAYNAIRAASLKKQQHGHDLLLSYLQLQSSASVKGKVLIEIGTTRENVPGQGSTRLLAELCKKLDMHFITVDMDPNNSLSAQSVFNQLNVGFEAITMKGEDYLRQYNGRLDFIFLDAYDFDHGMHSALRQDRYIKYLGAEIDEQQCHQMHLECAESLITKLSPDGIICFDDAWQTETGQWTAKGTLAVPYLLSNGFEAIEARNKAVLIRRQST